MRPIAEIDADFTKLDESFFWIDKAGHPESDINRFNEAKQRISIDFQCFKAVEKFGNDWGKVKTYLENERSYVQAKIEGDGWDVPPAKELDGCNGDTNTCARKAANITPFCTACRSL